MRAVGLDKAGCEARGDHEERQAEEEAKQRAGQRVRACGQLDDKERQAETREDGEAADGTPKRAGEHVVELDLRGRGAAKRPGQRVLRHDAQSEASKQDRHRDDEERAGRREAGALRDGVLDPRADVFEHGLTSRAPVRILISGRDSAVCSTRTSAPCAHTW